MIRLVVVLLSALLFGNGVAVAQHFTASSKYDDYFRKYTKRFFGVGFDWKVFKAQALAESNLNPDAQSWVGAVGVMQLMPSTFKDIKTKNPEFDAIDDAEWNIGAGIFYNRKLWKVLDERTESTERIRFTFAGYNAGMTRIAQAKNLASADTLDALKWENVARVAPKVPHWRYHETLDYVRRIDSLHALLLPPAIKP